jgi:hypothetical protein
VLDQTIGKRWVHHPIWRAKQKTLESEIDAHPTTVRNRERLAELRRPHLLATPVGQWAVKYLAAATSFYDANILIRKARREHRSSDAKPALLGTDSQLWLQLMEAAEGLAAHDLTGAADMVMVNESGLVPRLLSIQKNRGIGYDVSTGFQVLNAIMQSGLDNKQWDTLYTMAVKAYDLEAQFTPKQAGLYAAWR